MLSALTFVAAATLLQDAPTPEPARLVVLVVVDQLPTTQVERLADFWSGGIGRFVQRGRSFPDSAFLHGRTETGPGHGTIGTGCHPRAHGLVSNNWTETDASTDTYCVYDPDVTALKVDGPQSESGRSPAQMRTPALGDYLQAHDAASQVVAISSKDRGAVPIAGSAGGWALWWDRRGSTGFMSSTFYGEALPDWVAQWNAGWFERLLDGPFGGAWTSALPENIADAGTEADDRPGEYGRRTFPHPWPALSEPPTEREVQRLASAVYSSPCGDEFVLDLALAAVPALDLGGDEHVDLLSVSLSSCDTVGHRHGPLSREVTDLLLRADAKLETLFELLDERVGEEHWIAVLTADHGVLALPESLAEEGLPAERDSSAAVRAAFEAVAATLQEAYGSTFGLTGAGRGMRFSAAQLEAAGVDAAEVRRLAADELARVGAEFAAHVWTLEDLRDLSGDNELQRIEARSYDAARTPDVLFTPHRYHLIGAESGTSHGSPWLYDRRVPLVFLGPGFEPGAVDGPAGPVDIVPTLLARLGIDVPGGLDGTVR
jgi:predicted AlkP superfamily pyrophosphatase or phosphodiesterase